MKRVFAILPALLAAVFLAPVPASAQTYDLFQTDPSQHPSVNLSAISGLSPSTVSFQGAPISNPSCLGNTDTIVQRSDASGSLQPVVATLLLKNVVGTNATYNGTPVDVYAAINMFDGGSFPIGGIQGPRQKAGTMTIGADGSFSATLHVSPNIALVDSSGTVVKSVTDPSFDTDLSATGTTGPPTSTTPNCSQFPNGGIVVIKIVHTAPTHVHQVLPACAPPPPSSGASIGGISPTPVAVCADTVTTTSTSPSQTTAKPQ